MNAIEQAAEALRHALEWTGYPCHDQDDYTKLKAVDAEIHAALARLDAERAAVPPSDARFRELLDLNRPSVPPDRERLYNELMEMVEDRRVMGRDREWITQAALALRSSADGWREGAEAMREACAQQAVSMARYHDTATVSPEEGGNPYDAEENRTKSTALSDIAAAIRALPIPSPPAEEKTP